MIYLCDRSVSTNCHTKITVFMVDKTCNADDRKLRNSKIEEVSNGMIFRSVER